MKIVNVSYVYFPLQANPVAWIDSSRFFKGIWEAVSEKEEVHFFEFIDYNGNVERNGIHYHFSKQGKNALRFPFKINKAIAAIKPDVLLVHGLSFPLQVILLRLSLGRKVKIGVQHHGEKPFGNKFKRWVQQLAYHCVDAYFFTSIGNAAPWIKSGIIKNKNCIKEIMEISSIFQTASVEKARQETGVKGNHTYIWVGNLDANKDPMTVIKAFTFFIEQAMDAHLYMVFQTDMLLPEIKNWLLQNPNAANYIHLVGKVPHEALQHWFNSVDFIISSSHAEAGGVSVCEAMSCGCIPLLSAIPSFQSMTGNACGFLYPAGDTIALRTLLQTSETMDKAIEREKTLTQYRHHLSFDAIANTIQQTLSSL